MSVPASVLVIGGGPAAYTVVDQLRLRGYAGALAVVSEEGLPADRPPVSKEYLRGAMGRDELQFRDADWYAERDVTVVTGRAVSLDPDLGTVLLESGESLTAGLVVLATGAVPVSAAATAPRVPGVLPLYTADDADAVRAAWGPGVRVVVLGGGLIGSEAASAALEAGAEVRLVNRSEPASVNSFGVDAAHVLHSRHTERGIAVSTDVAVGERALDTGEVEVTLSSGEVLVADVVIDAGGAVPAGALAKAAGIAVAQDATGGVLVDAAGRTSHPAVLAVGDVTRRVSEDGAWEPWTGHWEAALHSAEDAVAALLGQNAETRGARWFWSDRHGEHVEVVGTPGQPGTVITRQDARGLRGVFVLDAAGRLRGAVTFSDARLARACRRLIDRATPVDATALADPEVAARELLRR